MDHKHTYLRDTFSMQLVELRNLADGVGIQLTNDMDDDQRDDNYGGRKPQHP